MNGRPHSKPPLGRFEYLEMPFGLTNAPAVFQSLINDVLRDMLHIFCFVYLDDILFFSLNMQEHRQHVWKILQTTWKQIVRKGREMWIPLGCCPVFFIHYWEGTAPKGPRQDKDSYKVANAIYPSTVAKMSGFCKFYRKFIWNYSQQAAPWTKLTSSKTTFWWTELKRLFTGTVTS